MTTEKQSTPITAEGLRGLGFNVEDGFSWVKPSADTAVTYWPATHHVSFCCEETEYLHQTLGTAPDLETIGRLIEVLKRMNGGGA